MDNTIEEDDAEMDAQHNGNNGNNGNTTGAMTFAEAIKKQIIERKQTRRGKRLLDIINDKPSRRRTRILDRLERHARLQLEDIGYKKAATIDDWSEVSEKDWGAFFQKLFEFLMKMLPLILPLFI